MAQTPVDIRASDSTVSRSIRLWRLQADFEERLGRIPFGKDKRTLRDDDDVYISEQLLAMEDVPFDYDLSPYYEPEEMPRWKSKSRRRPGLDDESLRRLFSGWAQAAVKFDMNDWSQLPSKFRYALKRPLMPQRKLVDILTGMGLASSFSYLLDMRKRLLTGRVQEILHGLDPDSRKHRDPKLVYRDRIKDGWGFEGHHGEDGQIQTSDITEPESQRVGYPRSTSPPRRTTESDEGTDVDLDAIAEDFICQYVEKIVGGLDAYTALADYRDAQGLQHFSPSQVEYILTQLQLSEVDTPSSATYQMSTGEGTDDNLMVIAQDFITWYNKDVAAALDPGIALTEYREIMGLEDFSTEEASFILGQWQSHLDRSPSPESETLHGSHTPGSFFAPISRDDPLPPPLNPAAAVLRQQDVTDASPEQGFTTKLWGLEMPTRTAKKLGSAIGLPDQHVHNIIRPSTPQRLTARTFPILSNSEMGPPPKSGKRKASETMHQGRRIRPSKTKSIDRTSQKSVLEATMDAPRDQNGTASEEDATPSILENIQVRHGIRLDEHDISRYMVQEETSFVEMPETIFEYLDFWVVVESCFNTNAPKGSERYNTFVRRVASCLKDDMAARIKSGEVLPIENDKHEELIALLFALDRDPKAANLDRLIDSICEAREEFVEPEQLEPELPLHPAKPLPPNHRAKLDRLIDSLHLVRHESMGAQQPLPPARNTVKDALEKPPHTEKLLSFDESSRPQPRRLRLTAPKKPTKGIPGYFLDGEPFLGSARELIDSAPQHGRSFFVHLEKMRQKRRRANVFTANDRYFQNSASATAPSHSGPTSSLNKLFEKYKDKSDPDQDTVGVEGSMRYLGDLGVKLDEVVLLAVLTELSAPTMGELSRSGFVDGWRARGANDLSAQKAVIRDFRKELSQPDFFRRVYKHTFKLALASGQKSLPLEAATEYWRLLLQPPSLHWYSPPTSATPQASPWLKWWLDYLETRWRKGVSRDMWDQTGKFVLNTLEPNGENLSWWSEDGAWPGVIDQFVEYVREKRSDQEGKMEQ